MLCCRRFSSSLMLATCALATSTPASASPSASPTTPSAGVSRRHHQRNGRPPRWTYALNPTVRIKEASHRRLQSKLVRLLSEAGWRGGSGVNALALLSASPGYGAEAQAAVRATQPGQAAPLRFLLELLHEVRRQPGRWLKNKRLSPLVRQLAAALADPQAARREAGAELSTADAKRVATVLDELEAAGTGGTPANWVQNAALSQAQESAHRVARVRDKQRRSGTSDAPWLAYGDLSLDEVRQIQWATNLAGQPTDVVGSTTLKRRRAAVKRWGLIKTKAASDIDYRVDDKAAWERSKAALELLPELDHHHGLVELPFDPVLGPALRFVPFGVPRIIEGSPFGERLQQLRKDSNLTLRQTKSLANEHQYLPRDLARLAGKFTHDELLILRLLDHMIERKQKAGSALEPLADACSTKFSELDSRVGGLDSLAHAAEELKRLSTHLTPLLRKVLPTLARDAYPSIWRAERQFRHLSALVAQLSAAKRLRYEHQSMSRGFAIQLVVEAALDRLDRRREVRAAQAERNNTR